MSIIDLEKAVGMPLSFDTELNRLSIGRDGVSFQPDIRTKSQMIDVLSSRGINKVPNELYYMYRGLGKVEHLPLLKKLGLRFDVTIIPAGKVGQRGTIRIGGESEQEYTKTLGHSHALPEIYEVLHGEAIYFMEDRVNRESRFARAESGDKIIIPSFMGHVTINPGIEKPLIMANFISARTVSEYAGYKELGGAMHFYVSDGDASRWIANTRYENQDIKEPREISKDKMRKLCNGFGCYQREPMYFSSARENFENLEFLQKVFGSDF